MDKDIWQSRPDESLRSFIHYFPGSSNLVLQFLNNADLSIFGTVSSQCLFDKYAFFRHQNDQSFSSSLKMPQNEMIVFKQDAIFEDLTQELTMRSFLFVKQNPTR
jgi:hypothetical protein